MQRETFLVFSGLGLLELKLNKKKKCFVLFLLCISVGDKT